MPVTQTSPLMDTDASGAEWKPLIDGVEINAAAWTEQAQALLPDEALAMLRDLHRALEPKRRELLDARREQQARYDRGETPGYLPRDEHPDAHGDWQVAEIPDDCLLRRVEITGPISETKMVIGMLSRNEHGDRADAAMLDFEDSMKPAWQNVLQGLENLIGAAKGNLEFTRPARGDKPEKHYTIDPDDMPLLMVRVRGLHLAESNLRVDGAPISAALFDQAMCAFHSAQTLIDAGKTPKYYVPKVEHYREARWFNRLFEQVQDALSIERGTFRATFLIETLPAAYQMEEILYEFRAHAAGLNGGRWDKIFSDIKVLKEHADRVLADRNWIDIQRPWMEMYVKHLIAVCHRHGAYGMGGMAPQTPGRTEEKRAEQMAGVREDKEFEAGIGHDGCWVSHPYFISPAMEPFEEKLSGDRKNQLDVRPDLPERPDLLPQDDGPKTLDGIRVNVRVSIGYMKGWNQDLGAVAWDFRMEDLATFEISRAQTWQWLHHEATLDDGTPVTPDLVRRVFDEEEEKILGEAREHFDGDAAEKQVNAFRQARRDAEAIFLEDDFRPFLAMASPLYEGE